MNLSARFPFLILALSFFISAALKSIYKNMNVRNHPVLFLVDFIDKAFVFSPPLGEVGKGLPLTADECELCGHPS